MPVTGSGYKTSSTRRKGNSLFPVFAVLAVIFGGTYAVFSGAGEQWSLHYSGVTAGQYEPAAGETADDMPIPDPMAAVQTPPAEAAPTLPGNDIPPVAAPVPAAAVPSMPAEALATENAPSVAPAPAPDSVSAPAVPDPLPASAETADKDKKTENTPAPAEEVAKEEPSPTPPPADKVTPLPVPEQQAQPASAAEKALVENAPVLEQMAPATKGAAAKNVPPAPAASAASEAEEAIIRPLPKGYLVLNKDKDPEEVDARLIAARRALAEGNSAAAVEMFDQLRAKRPSDSRILMGRAVALQQSGQNMAALSAYEEVLKKNPKDLDALTNMLGLLRKQSPQLALEKLQELRSTYPANAKITGQLGIVYGDAGQYDKALQYLSEAIAMEPGNISFIFNRAVIYDRKGDRVKAGEAYRQCLALYAKQQGAGGQSIPVDMIRNRLGSLH